MGCSFFRLLGEGIRDPASGQRIEDRAPQRKCRMAMKSMPPAHRRTAGEDFLLPLRLAAEEGFTEIIDDGLDAEAEASPMPIRSHPIGKLRRARLFEGLGYLLRGIIDENEMVFVELYPGDRIAVMGYRPDQLRVHIDGDALGRLEQA
jgi:hypothetical protein